MYMYIYIYTGGGKGMKGRSFVYGACESCDHLCA